MEYLLIEMALYLSQIILYTGLMLLVYMLLLRDKPLHKFNRVYLLSTVLLPIVIPFLKLPENASPSVANMGAIVMRLPEVIISSQSIELAPRISVSVILIVIYSVVCLLMLITQLYSYLKIRSVISKGKQEVCEGYILLKNTGYGPSSWGKYIFLPEGDVPKAIINHERAHIDLHHSRDVILMSILHIVFWPNAFLYFIRKELILLHEFQADEVAGLNNEEYTHLLLSSVFSTCTLPFTHSFIIHPIKRRIMMLNNKNKNRGPRGLFAVVIAMVIFSGIITVQSCQREKAAPHAVTDIDTTWWGPAVAYDNDSIRHAAHKMPEFDGDLYEFIGSYLRYPKAIQEAGIEGKVIVAFVIDKEGLVSQKQIIESPHDTLSKIVIDMLYKMPAWIPGEDKKGNKVAVWYTLPVTFKLEEKMSKKRDEVKIGTNKPGLYIRSAANVILDETGKVSVMPTAWQTGKDENGKDNATWSIPSPSFLVDVGGEHSLLDASSLASAKIDFEKHTGSLVFKIDNDNSGAN